MSIKLIAVRLPAARPFPMLVRVQWLGYCALVAVMVTYYLTVLLHGAGTGVDFACFRAAAILFTHGGNPYDAMQLWRTENALYNVPGHLQPGSPTYYYLDRYYNPPFFHALLVPLARLSFAQGYAIYSALVVALAVIGTWLTLHALGWTRRRAPVVVIVLLSPCFFLAVRNGQQSTLALCALGAALYALRRERPALAGALLAISWVKPHLLVPVALIAPLLLGSPRAMLRWYGGFFVATACGVALTILLAGAGSIGAWLGLLLHYSNSVDQLHTYLPSLSGASLVLLPHPWNRLVSTILVLAGVGVMAAIVVHARRIGGAPWPAIGLLVATWLLFTPYAHVNDDVLLLLPLAVAWGVNGGDGLRITPLLALWALSTLPLAFLLPRPWDLLGVLPVALVFVACGLVNARACDKSMITAGSLPLHTAMPMGVGAAGGG